MWNWKKVVDEALPRLVGLAILASIIWFGGWSPMFSTPVAVVVGAVVVYLVTLYRYRKKHDL